MIDSFLRYVEETNSTNDDMMRRMLDGAPHGAAIYAGAQRQGRGRQGRPWAGSPGQNLAISVAIVGERYRTHLPMIPLAVGVAMAELLSGHTNLHVDLKWPNDLLYDGKKLGGILCEGVHQGTRFLGAVVGVGINLNMTPEDFPEDLADLATSVRVSTGQSVDVDAFAESARLAIVAEIDTLMLGGRSALLARWEKRDVTRGRRVRILATDQIGTADGMARDGALHVRLDTGTLVSVRSGEVHLLRPEVL